MMTTNTTPPIEIPIIAGKLRGEAAECDNIRKRGMDGGEGREEEIKRWTLYIQCT